MPTPFEIECIREAYEASNAEAGQEHYLDGSNDAAFGDLPRWSNEAYLAGYVAKLKELPTNPDGSIKHYSPRQHFAFGYMDGAPECHCDDEF